MKKVKYNHDLFLNLILMYSYLLCFILCCLLYSKVSIAISFRLTISDLRYCYSFLIFLTLSWAMRSFWRKIIHNVFGMFRMLHILSRKVNFGCLRIIFSNSHYLILLFFILSDTVLKIFHNLAQHILQLDIIIFKLMYFSLIFKLFLKKLELVIV